MRVMHIQGKVRMEKSQDWFSMELSYWAQHTECLLRYLTSFSSHKFAEHSQREYYKNAPLLSSLSQGMTVVDLSVTFDWVAHPTFPSES